MDDFVKSVFTAPVATLFIVAGILFLLIAVVGNISGKLEPGVKGRIASGVLGLTFVLIGLAMHLTQKVPQMPGPPATSQEQIKRDQPAQASRTPTARETELRSEPPVSAPSTGDKEPNAVSTNRDKPTWLTTSEIKGTGVGDAISYYYTFNAGPGVVKVTLDGNTEHGGQGPSVEISDLDAKVLLDMLINYPGGIEERSVERFQLGRRQQVVLRVLLGSNTSYYMVRLEGAINFSIPQGLGPDLR